jgi:TubC N-terminal docking domain
MSASRFLLDLCRQGVILRLSDDRTRVLAPRAKLTPELRERLKHDKTEIVKLLGFVDDYRVLIRNAFAVMVHHASARKGLRAFAEEQAQLTDELGPALTAVIRDSEARQWRRDTGLCPVCGDDDKDCDMCREAYEAGAAD